MKLTAFIIFLLIFSQAHSQNDYFIMNGDTTVCSDLKIRATAQSYLSELNYTNASGEPVNIKGVKNLKDITVYSRNGYIIDRVPQKTNKPDGYIKWAQRVVDGKLIVNHYYSSMTTQAGTTSVEKFYVRLPDGKYYDINKRTDREEIIIPYLKQCGDFVSEYKGNFDKSYEEFVKTVKLYNSLCE